MHYNQLQSNLTVAIICCLGLVLVFTSVIFSKVKGDDSTTFRHTVDDTPVLSRLPFCIEAVSGKGTQFGTQFIDALSHGRSLFNLVQSCKTFSNILGFFPLLPFDGDVFCMCCCLSLIQLSSEFLYSTVCALAVNALQACKSF